MADCTPNKLTFSTAWLHAIMDCKDKRINNGTIGVACALVRRMPWKAGGEFKVSQAELAEWAHCTRNTIRAQVELLADLGFIELGEREHSRAPQSYTPRIPSKFDAQILSTQKDDAQILNNTDAQNLSNALLKNRATIHTSLQTIDQTEEEEREISTPREIYAATPPAPENQKRSESPIRDWEGHGGPSPHSTTERSREDGFDSPTDQIAKELHGLFEEFGAEAPARWESLRRAAGLLYGNDWMRSSERWRDFAVEKISAMAANGYRSGAIVNALMSPEDQRRFRERRQATPEQPKRRVFDREAHNAVPVVPDDLEVPSWLQ